MQSIAPKYPINAIGHNIEQSSGFLVLTPITRLYRGAESGWLSDTQTTYEILINIIFFACVERCFTPKNL